jgi:hypothetical protein
VLDLLSRGLGGTWVVLGLDPPCRFKEREVGQCVELLVSMYGFCILLALRLWTRETWSFIVLSDSLPRSCRASASVLDLLSRVDTRGDLGCSRT